MRRFNVLQAIPLSFFSKALYQDVARNWPGAAVGYLLLAMLLFWIPRAVRIQIRTAQFCTVRAPGVLRQIPPFDIKHGHVLIDAPLPVMIRDPKDNALLAVIDTAGQYTSPRQAGAHVLLTAHQLMIERSSGWESRSYDFPPNLDFRYEQAKGFKWLAQFGTWFATLVGLAGLLCFWLSALIKVLIFSALGLALARNRDPSFQFQTAFRVAAVAITPALFYDFLLAWTRSNFVFSWVLGFAIALAYLWFAVQAATGPGAAAGLAPPASAPPPAPPPAPTPVH